MNFLGLFVLVAMPFGFILSLSYFFGITFHTNVIDRFYSIIMIISVLIIFFIFLLPMIRERLKKTNNFRPTFVILSVAILVFLSITNLFKYISDYLLKKVLVSNSDEFLEDIRINFEEYINNDNAIVTSNISVMFEGIKLFNYFILDDNSSITQGNQFYLVYLLIYFLFIFVFFVILIGLFYKIVDVKQVSDFFGSKLIIFFANQLKNILNKEQAEKLDIFKDKPMSGGKKRKNNKK
jgi:hypothetical protein